MIDSVKSALNKPLNFKEKDFKKLKISPKSNINKNKFIEMVSQQKFYIFNGDIFQVVISQSFQPKFNQPPFELYRSLRGLNPSPFLFI